MRILISCTCPSISEIREVNFVPSIGMRVYADYRPMPKAIEVVAFPPPEYIIQITGKMHGPIDAIVLCE